MTDTLNQVRQAEGATRAQRMSVAHKTRLLRSNDNIATNLGGGTEDEIYVVPQRECHLWEDPQAPLYVRAEQPLAASLGILLVAYSYFVYTFSRYASGAMAKIAGTGLVTPVFA
jgi:hypothetical protein